ncbi:NDR1/HIN1-like protein 12 isoform X1 [Physcomitrium patens]|nr:NDR1/HIN1-like protein 10 isoform X1 [Physcomitrium patens]|eukprot:XP_024371529.1 NDR1/HIN1-like protein 10 isoform X1 [Physcomitrella patens]
MLNLISCFLRVFLSRSAAGASTPGVKLLGEVVTEMGFLDVFSEKRNMRYQRGEKVHPASFDNLPASSIRTSSAALGTPSKGSSGKSKREPPMGWDKAGGFPNLPLPPPATQGRPRRKPSSSCSVCYCLSLFFSFLIIIIILAGLTILIFYIIFQPRLPKATILNVVVTSFNVTNKNGGPIASLADSQNPVLNANIAFTIQVENPNDKLGIHFRDLSVFVSYNGTQFAHSFVPPFYQGKKTKSEVIANLKATSAPLSQSQGQDLQAAIGQNDIPLSARITVGAALEIGSWIIPPGHIQVLCQLRVSPPTSPAGAKLLSKSCKWVRNAKI